MTEIHGKKRAVHARSLELVGRAAALSSIHGDTLDWHQLGVCGGYAHQRLEQPDAALAAYNAGPGRVGELRARAANRGLDPDRWFGQVELQAARDVGRETVTYVGNIVKYYVVYRRIAEQEEARRLARQQIVAR